MLSPVHKHIDLLIERSKTLYTFRCGLPFDYAVSWEKV